MDKSKIDRSMYQKAKVEASEKEHIAAPASTMLADAWIRLKKKQGSSCSIIYFDRNYPACHFCTDLQ